MASPALLTRKSQTDAIREYLGTTLVIQKLPDKRTGTTRTVVAIGDLHGNPHPALLQLIIAAKPDLIIVGGDVYDQAAFSNHPKGYGEQVEAFELEQCRIRAWFETVLARTKAKVIIMRGNHDDRFYKQLLGLLPAHFMPFVKDPLDVLIADIPSDRIEVHGIQVQMHHPSLPPEELGRMHYMMPLGDALLSHANFTGGETTTAVEKLQKWVNNWRQPLGWPDMALLVQFHTHQWVYLKPKAGFVTLVEPGMGGMPAVEGYKIGYQSKWRPGTLGATVFKQELWENTWHTVHNSVNWLVP